MVGSCMTPNQHVVKTIAPILEPPSGNILAHATVEVGLDKVVDAMSKADCDKVADALGKVEPKALADVMGKAELDKPPDVVGKVERDVMDKVEPDKLAILMHVRTAIRADAACMRDMMSMQMYTRL